MREVISGIVSILNESSPYLLLGFGLAGVIHVVLSRFPRLTAQLTGPGARPIFMAALIGAPMPLCSCSVLPAAMALRREGASKGATASFLVSVPETDIVSVLVTLALIGPAVAIYRPIAAIVGALATGMFVHWMETREARRHPTPAPAHAAASCCHDGTDATGPVHTTAAPVPWWRRAYRYGFIEIFDDIIPQLFLGIVLAGIIGAWLPAIDPKAFEGGTLLSYLVMAAIAAPLYVCATASTPIAAGLIAGGVSPGAAMVFLLAGPATNLGSLVVLRGTFGVRILAGYLGSIVVTSVLFGAALDWMIGSTRIPAVVPVHSHATTSPFQIACTAAFLLWTAVSVRRSRLFPRLWLGFTRTAARLSPAGARRNSR